MTNQEITEALMNLVPDAQWVLVGDDYLKIDWIAGTKPSLKQIQDKIANLAAEREQKQIELATVKASAETKLTALGLTADEIAALRG